MAATEDRLVGDYIGDLVCGWLKALSKLLWASLGMGESGIVLEIAAPVERPVHVCQTSHDDNAGRWI